MTITNVTQLRNLLDTFMHSTAKKGSLPATRDLVVAFRKDHKSAVDDVSTQLVDIALTKLVGEVSDRKRDPIPNDKQADLFGHYPGIPEWITIPIAAQNRRKCQRMLFSKATFGEVESWIKEGGRTLRPRATTHKGVTALMKDIEAYVTSPDTTIEKAYTAMVAAKTKAA